MKNIIIVGGGSAGWFAAGWLSKKHKDISITLIESPDIPKIGVGESVTPHVALFFDALEIPWKQWMYETGSIYKFANKFVDWKQGKGEYEYFSFAPNFDTKLLYKDTSQPLSKIDWTVDPAKNKITDLILHLNNQKVINRYDQYLNGQFHYMEKNNSPFIKDEYLLNPLFSWSQHINAELAAEFIRDVVAKPNGVIHVQGKVKEVIVNDDKIDGLILDSGQRLSADFYIDASGFHKILVSKLDWKEIPYNENPIDRAYVCQIDYENPEKEMVNYTQSIAKKHGWMFKIGLYHRMGTGYCFSSSHVSEDKALEEYLTMVSNLRREPRLIKWKPSRLDTFAKNNVAAIGLSCGFVEPMEANALYITINSIQLLSKAIKNNPNNLNFTELNEKMSYVLDDIADFIKVHYTLSERENSQLWLDMRNIGKNNNHKDLLVSKYVDKRNSMIMAISGYSMFPDYMWGQLAHAWGIDTSNWFNTPNDLDIELTKINIFSQEKKHDIVSSHMLNNYQWLKQEVFKNYSSSEWEKTVLLK